MNNNCNLAGLVERVKHRLKDADYDEQDIKQFLNEAYFEVMNDGHYSFLERTYQMFASESAKLETPCDFQSVAKLTANDGNKLKSLKYMPYDEYFNHEEDSAINNYSYTIFGNNLLFTVPKLPENQYYTIQLYYLAKPVAMVADDDKTLIPNEFSEILVLGALKRAERLRDNFDYAQIYENDRQDMIINMKARYCPRQQNMENRAKLPVHFNMGVF